jgi:branched-chain amino acid transport system substrate-binding protein
LVLDLRNKESSIFVQYQSFNKRKVVVAFYKIPKQINPIKRRMRKMKKTAIIILLVTVFTLFVTFKQSQAVEEFRFGASLPLSGPGSVWGVSQHNAVKMAVEEINGKGGITVGGKKYMLAPLVYDDKGAAAEGISIFEKLTTRDNVNVMIGPLNSNIISALAPKIGERAIVLTVGTIVSDYTKLGNPNIFRPHLNNEIVGKGTVDFLMKDLDVKELGFIASKIQFSYELVDIVKKEFEKEGRKYKIEYADLPSTNLYPQLTSLGKVKDTVFYSGYVEQAALMVKQMKELGIKPKNTVLYATGTSEEYMRVSTPEIMEGVYEVCGVTIDALISQGSKKALEYDKRFKEKYGIGPAFPAGCTAYDAVYILARGVENAGTTTDIVKIRTALKNLGKIPETITDYPLVNGKMFDKDNNAYTGGAIKQFRNGKMQFIKFHSLLK